MKKVAFILLVVAGAINVGQALAGTRINLIPAALFLFAAFAIFKSEA